MDPRSKDRAEKRRPAVALTVLGCALLGTVAGTALSVKLWRGLPQSQAAGLEQNQIQTHWLALLRNAPTSAREGTAVADAARELMPAIAPQGMAAPQIGQRLRNAMGAPSTHVGRLLVAAAILAQGESEGRPVEQAWPALKPYLESSPTAPYAHFAAAREDVLRQVYRELSIRDGTAAALATVGPELLSPFLQYFLPRMILLEQARLAAGDPSGAELCRKAVRRLLREWTLEPGNVGTRLVAADLLARDLMRDPTNEKLVSALRSWRSAYRDAARIRPTAMLSVSGSEPDPAPAESAALVGAVAGSVWLSIAAVLTGIVALVLNWAIFRDSSVLGDWRTFAGGGLIAIGVCAAAAITIRTAGPAIRTDLRGMMARADRAAPAAPKRADEWHSAYRAQLPWVAAGWTFAALAAGAFSAAMVLRRNRLGSAAGVLAIGWALIVLSWVAQSAWGLSRLSRYETALADAYRKGSYAAIAGDSAEALLAPLREWRP